MNENPINLDIAISEVRRSWGQWCNDYQERLNDITMARAAVLWAITNGATYSGGMISTTTGNLPDPEINEVIQDVLRSAPTSKGVIDAQ
jgi:hypothetical protein